MHAVELHPSALSPYVRHTNIFANLHWFCLHTVFTKLPKTAYTQDSTVICVK